MKRVAADATEPVMKRVRNGATERVIERVTERVTERVMERVMDRVTDRVMEPVMQEIKRLIESRVMEPVMQEMQEIKRLIESKQSAPADCNVNPRTSLDRAETSEGRGYKLRFANKLQSTIFTDRKIKDESNESVKIVLFDTISTAPVTSGPLSSIKIQILVLDGDFGFEAQENWTEQDFNDKVVHERDGKRPLVTGELNIMLRDGVGIISDLSFTDNSSWIKCRKFRLGARVVQSIGGHVRIKEAISEAFVVKDHRTKTYGKHHPPSLDDEVWRLEKIRKDGKFHQRLASHHIDTVKDFMRKYVTDPTKLRELLNCPKGAWDTIVEHASTCAIDDEKFYSYSVEGIGLLFNSIYMLVAASFDGHNYQSLEKLSVIQKSSVESKKEQAYKNVNNFDPVDELAIFGPSKSLTSLQELKADMIRDMQHLVRSSSAAWNVNARNFKQMYKTNPDKLREILKDCTDPDWEVIVKDASCVVDDESPVLHQAEEIVPNLASQPLATPINGVSGQDSSQSNYNPPMAESYQINNGPHPYFPAAQHAFNAFDDVRRNAYSNPLQSLWEAEAFNNPTTGSLCHEFPVPHQGSTGMQNANNKKEQAYKNVINFDPVDGLAIFGPSKSLTSLQDEPISRLTTQNHFLAVGEDNQIKFWDMDSNNVLTSTEAEGGLVISASAVSSVSPVNCIVERSFPVRPSPIINGFDPSSRNMEKPRTMDDVNVIEKTKPWQLAEISESGQCRLLTLPESADSSSKTVRLLYTNSGVGILALGSSGIQKLWKWPHNDHNPRGKAAASVVPQHWLPNNGLIMTNDISNVNLQEAVPCIALSKNDSYVISATGGKVSLFNLITFKVMVTFMPTPPSSTFLAFHPHDTNIIAIGMEDSTIHIYNVRVDEVKSKLKGHHKRITGLAFSSYLNILVSSGADAQLSVWSIDTWEKRKSVTIQIPIGKAPNGDTQVHFHSDQIRMLVVHETQLAIYDASKMEGIRQWVPQDVFSAPISCATYSCNSQLVYATFCDGNIGVFDADTLRLRCHIFPTSYISQAVLNGSQAVYPLVVAAHPLESNQFAVGLTDGTVKVLEPLEPKGKWGVSPPGDNGMLNGRTTSSSTSKHTPDQLQR